MSDLTPGVRLINVDLLVTDQLINDSGDHALHTALLEALTLQAKWSISRQLETARRELKQ
jgi:RecJ-like exonuclease